MSLSSLFQNCREFNQNIASWNLNTSRDHSDLENIRDMFYGCTRFNQNLHNWNVTGTENEDAFSETPMINNPRYLPIGIELIQIEREPARDRLVRLERERLQEMTRLADMNPNIEEEIDESMEVHNAAKDIKEEMMIEATELIKNPRDSCDISRDDFHEFVINSLRRISLFLPVIKEQKNSKGSKGSKDSKEENDENTKMKKFKTDLEQGLNTLKERLTSEDCVLPRYKLCFIYHILQYLIAHGMKIPPEQLQVYLQGAILDSALAYNDGRDSCLGGMYERIFLFFIHLIKISPELVRNDPRLEEVVEVFDIPTNLNLSERLNDCLKNFSKRFNGKHDFYLDQYDPDLRKMPSPKEIDSWLKRCLEIAYPRPSHTDSINEFVRTMDKELVNDLVYEAYLKYNLPTRMNECMENYGRELTEMPSWDVAKERIKTCLLDFFGQEGADGINIFISENKDQIIENINEIINLKKNPRRREREEEEEKEEGPIGGGKKRTKKNKKFKKTRKIRKFKKSRKVRKVKSRNARKTRK